jgi:uncharacterized protein (PEP-CTERM system associated)
VGTLLDRLFKSRIPDPLLRREAVDRYKDQQSLPNALNGAVNFYSEDILLTDSVTATAGLTGVRNNVFFTAYYSRNRPIAGSSGSLVGESSADSNNTQYGVNGVWTYRITPADNLVVSMALSRTDAIAPATGRTDQGGVGVELNHALSQHTRVFLGARYQRLMSDVAVPYTESAAYAGIGYTYR